MYRIICPMVELSVARYLGDMGTTLPNRRHTWVEYWPDQSYVTLPNSMFSCNQ